MKKIVMFFAFAISSFAPLSAAIDNSNACVSPNVCVYCDKKGYVSGSTRMGGLDKIDRNQMPMHAYTSDMYSAKSFNDAKSKCSTGSTVYLVAQRKDGRGFAAVYKSGPKPE